MPDSTETRLRAAAADLIEFVRLGFHDCSLDFKVRLGRADHLADVLNAAGDYNDFEPSRVFHALADVLPSVSSIEFGREASPVMYVEIPHWEHQAMGWDSKATGRVNGERLDPEARTAAARKVADALKAAGADELSLEPDWNFGGTLNREQRWLGNGGADLPADLEGTIKLRAWWD
jgi:hypothetical protein